MFFDEAKILVASGAGGRGCISFRREKNIAFGGPNGGAGGRGGDILFHTNPHLNTLMDFRYKSHFRAARGAHGQGSDCTGHAGASLILEVPLGTEVWDSERNTLLTDLTLPNFTWTFLEGGIGGLGNASFKNSVRQAPRFAQPGQPGQEMWVRLKLKLLAEIGLIGFPNAGKSTLLGAVTRAHPKIGNYPFTTLHPQLGVMHLDHEELVLADLPGLVEGAHEGRGLGHRFLAHTQRCGMLLHVIDATTADPLSTYNAIRHELECYDPYLMEKPEWILLNKADAISEDMLEDHTRLLHAHTLRPVFCASALLGTGLRPLTTQLFQWRRENRTP